MLLSRHTRRREFISLLGGAAVWPLAARAQRSTRIAKIGHIESGWPSSSPNLLAAFRQGLRELGYIEGETFFIERRYAEGREDRLPQLAAELVNLVWTSFSRLARPKRSPPQGRRIESRLYLSAAAIRSPWDWSRV